MEDAWRLASEAFTIGTRKTAKTHLQSALAALSPSSRLQRAIYHVNLHAISSFSDTPPLPPIPSTASKNACIRLLAEEAYLTAVYNATLRALRNHPQASVQNLTDAVRKVPSVLDYLSNVDQSAPFQQQDCSHEAINLSIDRLVSDVQLRDPDLRKQISRWADAAATCYELLSAASHLQHRPVPPTIARSLRDLINTLSTPESFDPTQAYDAQAARTQYLRALSESAVMTPVDVPDEDLHLPLAYASAVKQLLSRDPSAKRLLEVCASRNYRLPDCLSLLARLEQGEDALSAWQRAFAVDVRRPVGLWLAAREFGRLGKYPQQAKLLACLEDLLNNDLPTFQGVKIDNFVMTDEDVTFENVVTSQAVIAERARALAGAGEWDDVNKMLNRLDDACSSADILRDRALCAVCTGDVQGGLSLAETARAASAGPTDSAGALLVQAEGLLRSEKVDEAKDKLMQAFREAQLGVVGITWEAEAPRLLRGVVFHNLAVLHYCLNENVAADECFAAAETAFKKCENECKEIAARMGVLSALGRCLGMWGRGMKEDAAEYWRVVRGLNINCMEDEDGNCDDGEDLRPDCHVIADVPEDVLQRFDQVCLNVCREVEKRKEMERMIEEVEKEWPLGQKRRQGT